MAKLPEVKFLGYKKYGVTLGEDLFVFRKMPQAGDLIVLNALWLHKNILQDPADLCDRLQISFGAVKVYISRLKSELDPMEWTIEYRTSKTSFPERGYGFRLLDLRNIYEKR